MGENDEDVGWPMELTDADCGWRDPRRVTATWAFPVIPVGKPRMTRRDQWLTGRGQTRPAVAQYHAFADALRMYAARDCYVPKPGDHLIFWIPMPASWSQKKRQQLCGQPHEQKPDIDNLAKAFFDALLSDDSGIWLATIEKRWAARGSIDVRRVSNG